MSLTKDGFYKQIGGAIGNNSYLLQAGGGAISYGNASGNIPISNGTVNTNLNADLLDGIHASGLFTKFDNSGNSITATIGGTTKTFTVNYATNSTYSTYSTYQSIYENNTNNNCYISFANNTSYSLSYIDSSLYYNPYLNALGHGTNVSAIGENSHAEGYGTTAYSYSHAEGSCTTAYGYASHAEGYSTTAYSYSHTEGYFTKAYGDYSHAEGFNTTVSSDYSHAEGYNTTASGNCSHAEGVSTIASGNCSHAEGSNTMASSVYSHTEGLLTQASSDRSHAEGWKTIASGKQSHTEGTQTEASGDSSHAEGSKSKTTSKNAHAEGTETLASNEGSHAEGGKTVASGKYSHTEGYQTTASGDYAHAEGRGNTSTPTGASGDYSHSEGNQTISSGESSHAEGEKTTASGEQSHAEGVQTKAEGNYSHAEGYKSTVISTAEGGHVEGKQNEVQGIYAHAEGLQSFAIGNYSHVEGEKNYARGYASHAGGKATETKGQYSFAFGWGSLTNNDYEASFGKWNKSNSDTIFSIGNGSSNSNRSNLLEVTTSGLIISTGGFKKANYDDNYVLLAGGGHKLESNLNVYSATKLANVRTLWGQSFDGTANVSGNMSSVGNISFSASGKNIGSILYFDTTNSRLGVSTSSPSYKLHVAGDIYTTTGFKKANSSDSYVLLGGGGHKLESDLNVSSANKLNSTGYQTTGLSFYQTSNSFDGSVAEWAHYIIANHGDGTSNGANYYHYTLRLPFWGIPQYRRQTGNTSEVTNWFNFITDENISSQTVAMANGLSGGIGIHGINGTNNDLNSNLLNGNRIYFHNENASNTPVSGVYGTVLQISNKDNPVAMEYDNWISQLDFVHNGDLYYRSNINENRWTEPWKKVLTNYNSYVDSSGKGYINNVPITDVNWSEYSNYANEAGYASTSGYAGCLNNYTISNTNTQALIDNKVRWFAQINKSGNYAGNNYGFPVSNNANGILYLGTHSGKYGHQLGFSSNGSIYHRYQNGSDFPNTANGGSWSRLITEANFRSILDSHYINANENDTMNGNLTINGSLNLVTNASTHSGGGLKLGVYESTEHEINLYDCDNVNKTLPGLILLNRQIGDWTMVYLPIPTINHLGTVIFIHQYNIDGRHIRVKNSLGTEITEQQQAQNGYYYFLDSVGENHWQIHDSGYSDNSVFYLCVKDNNRYKWKEYWCNVQ